jgi:hypothetical protein
MSVPLTDSELTQTFPNLSVSPDTNTSPPTPDYNCIVYAAGRTEQWWEPAFGPGSYWLPGAPHDYQPESLAGSIYGTVFCILRRPL